MKTYFTTRKMLNLAVLSAYLFTQFAGAAISNKQETQPELITQQSQIMSEIKSGFTEILADIGFPEVKPQVHKLLQNNNAELQAADLVNASAGAQSEYKFKGVSAPQ